MSLNVDLKYLDGIMKGGLIYVKLIFRGNDRISTKVKGNANVFFGQKFSWPMARKIENNDFITLKVYSLSNILSNSKLLGTVSIGLESLASVPILHSNENLIDHNQKITENMLTFNIEYNSPVSGATNLGSDTFSYPVYDLATLKRYGNKGVRLPSENSSDEDDDYIESDDNEIPKDFDDNISELSLLPERDWRLPKNIDPLLLKEEHFEVSITLVEARNLTGRDLNPMFEIICAGKTQATELRMQTNSPFYNQYFNFEINMSKIKMMEQIIKIRGLSKSNNRVAQYIFKPKLIGEFTIDTKTVYSNENHSFFGKWAVLIDPKAPTSGEKGYVKVNISVLCGGDKPKRAEAEEHEDNPNIEGNLLLPQNVQASNRRLCEMSVMIFTAEDLPSMNTDIVASIKRAFIGEGKSLTDAYVEVSFAGFSGRTKTISNNYNPSWNQQISFTERFPPFVSRIRIAVRDSDAVKDVNISTVFIDLHKIMYVGSIDEEGFLPTYGPSWINLYGTPRTYSYSQLMQGDEGRNENLAEGVAYRGRLLIAIKTLGQADVSKIGVDVRPCNPVSNLVAGRRENYLLFASIFEANLINAEVGNNGKPITFEMTIGTYGNVLDELPVAQDAESTENKLINSTTTQRFAYTFDNYYFYIPYLNKKPCLYIICPFEDQRPRMFIPNMLEKLKIEMAEIVRQINYILIKKKGVRARRYLRVCIEKLLVLTEKTLSSVKSCRGTAKKTMLDQKNQKLIKLDLERMKVRLRMLESGLSRKNIRDRIKDIVNLMKVLEDKIHDPQYGLPDVFLSMIQENQRIGYTRIKSRDLIHSVIPAERGVMCGTMSSVYLKKIAQPILIKKPEGGVQCQLQLYMWLGLLKDMRGYRIGLPEGYNKECFKEKLPPKFIEYTEQSMFQLRVYLFMARNVIGADESGLSDPFVQVILNEHIMKSNYINETRSPQWDETLIIDKIIFHYAPEVLKSSPPTIIVELFDYDSETDSEFIGRVFCQPNVFLKGDEYVLPKLQWWSAFRGTLPAGDILAAFDMLEMDITLKKIVVSNTISIQEIEEITAEMNANVLNEVAPKYRIPLGIRPDLLYFRLEIIMWGLRRLKRIKRVFMVKTPRILIEIGGYRIESDTLENYQEKPNFEENVYYVNLRLPTNTQFWPPISIMCIEYGIFGMKRYVGNHVINSPQDFYQREEQEEREIDKTTISNISEDISSIKDEEDTKEMINEAYEHDEHDGKQDPALPNGNVPTDIPQDAKPGNVEKVKPKIPKDEFEAANWWTRYYATLGDPVKEEDVVEKLSESESDEELVGDVLNGIKVEVKEDDEKEDVIEMPEEIEKKKKKKKKKKRKKKKKKNLFKKSGKELFLRETADDLKMEGDFLMDNSWIERIKVYPVSLENVKDFGGFKEPFLSFPLTRGRQEEGEDEYIGELERFGGEFKGMVCLYNIEMEQADEECPHENLRLYKLIVDNDPVEFLVRVYIVKAINLHPADLNGKSDPYLVVRLGEKEINDKENYIPKNLNPIFGKCFEMEVTFPQESFLEVFVYDWDRLSIDDLIGSTTIDLESRWLSKHRGSCGLMPTYHDHGFLKWKDSRKPSHLLRELCREHNIPDPTYVDEKGIVEIQGQEFIAETSIETDDGTQTASQEPRALEVLHNWDKIVPDCKLVPEHIETRPLYLPEKPGIEQGLLEMWVDMYEKDSAFPPAIDITPIKPVDYELRIIIHRTEKVRLTDTNFLTNEKSVDIYLKSWMISTTVDLQKTDVHYKSLSGQGLFNWRFVFKFSYLRSEDYIVYKTKKPFEIDESEDKTPCFLSLQVCDSNMIFSDTVLGVMKFRLSKFPQPAKSYKSCDPFQHSESVAKFSIFRNKKVRGWWPLIYNPKDEDEDDDDGQEIGGCVEMEMELVTAEEAESNPVGKAREEPMPLEHPNRPDGSFLNFLNPLNSIKYFIKYRLKWILIKLLVIILAVLILVLFFYNFPGNFSRVIVDKMSG